MSSEATARIVIDRLLREAGWNIENPAIISTEEAAADGRADYLLKSQASHRGKKCTSRRDGRDV